MKPYIHRGAARSVRPELPRPHTMFLRSHGAAGRLVRAAVPALMLAGDLPALSVRALHHAGRAASPFISCMQQRCQHRPTAARDMNQEASDQPGKELFALQRPA